MSNANKRSLDSVTTENNEASKAESSSDLLKSRKGNKPGRKPLGVEAKNKRTAQNRAAQRAFRERKERKMNELEKKVEMLEKINAKNEVTSKFLKTHILSLINELKKYRPEKEIDSSVLEYLSNLESQKIIDGEQNLTADQIQSSVEKKMDFTFEFPWNNVNTPHFPSPDSISAATTASSGSYNSNHRSSASFNPNEIMTSSTASSSFNLFDDNDGESLPRLDTYSKQIDKEFDFNSHFDESVSEFCSKLNQACGTAECPIPLILQTNPNSNDIPSDLPQFTDFWTQQPSFSHLSFNTDLQAYKGFKWAVQSRSGMINTNKQDSLSFIDSSLAFPMASDKQDECEIGINKYLENDPIVSTFSTENSIFEVTSSHNSLSNTPKTPIDGTTQQLIKNKKCDDDDDDSSSLDVVPSGDDQLLKCSEVWDRITAHPKYSDLDIDSLCMELRTKAKCSEKGVVVNVIDMQNALAKHMV